MKTDPELRGYFAEAASWDADRIAQGRRTVRLALGVAGAAWLTALALAAALMLLMPLKHVEPFVIRVDNATGMVDVVPVYAGKSAAPEAISRQATILVLDRKQGIELLTVRNRAES